MHSLFFFVIFKPWIKNSNTKKVASETKVVFVRAVFIDNRWGSGVTTYYLVVNKANVGTNVKLHAIILSNGVTFFMTLQFSFFGIFDDKSTLELLKVR